MYLRHSTRRKDGKVHTYWRLVRSVRRDRKVVQETVAQLAERMGKGAHARQRWRSAFQAMALRVCSAGCLKARKRVRRLR